MRKNTDISDRDKLVLADNIGLSEAVIKKIKDMAHGMSDGDTSLENDITVFLIDYLKGGSDSDDVAEIINIRRGKEEPKWL